MLVANSTDITYLTSAVSQLQTALSNNSVTAVPVGSALLSGSLVTPSPAIAADMQTLIGCTGANVMNCNTSSAACFIPANF